VALLFIPTNHYKAEQSAFALVRYVKISADRMTSLVNIDQDKYHEAFIKGKSFRTLSNLLKELTELPLTHYGGIVGYTGSGDAFLLFNAEGICTEVYNGKPSRKHLVSRPQKPLHIAAAELIRPIQSPIEVYSRTYLNSGIRCAAHLAGTDLRRCCRSIVRRAFIDSGSGRFVQLDPKLLSEAIAVVGGPACCQGIDVFE